MFAPVQCNDGGFCGCADGLTGKIIGLQKPSHNMLTAKICKKMLKDMKNHPMGLLGPCKLAAMKAKKACGGPGCRMPRCTNGGWKWASVQCGGGYCGCVNPRTGAMIGEMR